MPPTCRLHILRIKPFLKLSFCAGRWGSLRQRSWGDGHWPPGEGFAERVFVLRTADESSRFLATQRTSLRSGVATGKHAMRKLTEAKQTFKNLKMWGGFGSTSTVRAAGNFNFPVVRSLSCHEIKRPYKITELPAKEAPGT
jgi:hypothetical protein